LIAASGQPQTGLTVILLPEARQSNQLAVKGPDLVRDRDMGIEIWSPARLSGWVNAVATRPRTLTFRMPSGPVRVNSVWVSMNLNASSTASVGPFDRGRRGRPCRRLRKIHSDRIGGEEQGLRIHQLREDEDRVVLRADADKAHTSRRRLRRSGRLWRRGRSPTSHRLAPVSLLGAPFANSSAPMRESTALRVGASRLELLTPCL
jgi:hypothetical protein